VKQLLSGEINGVRFRGRPNMQWIDCISEDLKTFNISNNPEEEWQKIRYLALDQVKWKSLMEGEGIDLAVIQWMAKNRERRKKRMIRQSIVPVQFDIAENMEFEGGEGIIREFRARKIEQEVSVKNRELEELCRGGYLRRSPLENNPRTAMSNLGTKLGNRVASEIFEYYESLMRGEEKKLDNFETWTTSIIKIWMGESKMIFLVKYY